MLVRSWKLHVCRMVVLGVCALSLSTFRSGVSVFFDALIDQVYNLVQGPLNFRVGLCGEERELSQASGFPVNSV